MLNKFNIPLFSPQMNTAILKAIKCNAFPNPKVSSVLFDKNQKLKGYGIHNGPGTLHAEIELIKNVPISYDDTLYVTLEPCFHEDTSPSCAHELLKTPIKNIVIGDIDVDSRTNGKSIELLKNNGVNISIEKGVNSFLNPHYINQKLHNDPSTMIGKIATSVNNKINDFDSESKYLTNEYSLYITHILRSTVDAILIGKNTLLNDDPKLNIRINQLEDLNKKKIILWGNSSEDLERHAKKHTDFIFVTYFKTNLQNAIYLKNDKKLSTNLFREFQINSILVEGGNSIHKYLIDNMRYNYFYWFKNNNNIKNGTTFNKNVQNIIKSDYKVFKQIQLNDNNLTTYNYK